jgi:hypothetical protein
LHNLFSVRLIAGDADRQTQRTATVRGHKLLGRRRLTDRERVDEPPVAIGQCVVTSTPCVH